MPITITEIFNGPLQDNTPSISNSFNNSDFLYLVSPEVGDYLQTDEYLEINAALVLEVQVGTKRLITLEETISTRDLYPIPKQYKNCLDMQVCLLPTDGFQANLYAVKCDEPCSCKEDLEDIKNKLNLILIAEAATIANQIAQDIALATYFSSIGVLLSPFTGGASLAIPGSTLPALAPGSAALLPTVPLLAGFLLLP